MTSTSLRALLVGFAMAALFAVSILVLLRVLPGPHTPADYLIIGSLSALLVLLLLFVLAITTWFKRPHTFYKKRRRE